MDLVWNCCNTALYDVLCGVLQDYVVKQGLTSNQADILLSTLTTPPYSYHASIATLHLSQLVRALLSLWN